MSTVDAAGRDRIDVTLAELAKQPRHAPTARNVQLHHAPGLATAIVGPRAAGKTWRMHQARLEASDRGQLYLNLEHPLLLGWNIADLSRLIDTYAERIPPGTGIDLYLDEVQLAEHWERLVRHALDDPRFAVTITGSSSRLLSSELGTTLRGRTIEIEVLPFSLLEWLRHRRLEDPAGLSAEVLQRQGERWLHHGGFPTVQRGPEAVRHSTLRAHLTALVVRDVVERHGIERADGLRRLAEWIVRHPGALLSNRALVRRLNAQGLDVSLSQSAQWLRWLQDAYLWMGLEFDSWSDQQRRVRPVKVHPIDTGLVRAYSVRGKEDLGPMLETAVAWELRRRGAELTYLVTQRDREVDLVARWPDGRAQLIQVCWDIRRDAVLDRELAALDEATTHPWYAEADTLVLVNRGVERVDGGEQHPIHDVWRWLVTDDDAA